MDQQTIPLPENERPFMFGYLEEVDIGNPSYSAAGATEYSTNSGGRESGYDSDP